jgi:hypothetical protein
VSSHRQRWGFLAVAASLMGCAALVLFGRALFLGHSFAERDLGAFYYPAKALIAPLAHAAGGIPLWNPFSASGQPFAANPENELFHPMTALFFVLPFEWAFRLQVIIPPLIAVPCMAWFLRVLRRSRSAALMGGLAWGLGGLVLSATCLLPELFTAVPMPLTVGFAVLAMRKPSVPSVVGLGFCLALQSLAGEPGTLLALPFLLAAALLGESRRRSGRGWAGLAIGLGLGLAIAAAAIVPGLHHASRTIRATGLTDSMANEWSMPAVRLFELFSPHVLGHVDRARPERYWGASYYGTHVFAFYYSLYPGLLVSVLALGAWVKRRRAALAWAAAALVGFALAQGDRFLLWPLLRQLPGLSGVRFPEKLSVLCVFATVVAAAHGFDWFVLGGRARRSLFIMLGGCCVAGVVLAGGLSLARLPVGFPVRDAAGAALRVAAVALVLAFVLWLSSGWRRQTRGLVLCALLGLDLVDVGRSLVPTVPQGWLANPPAFLRPLLLSDRDQLVFHMADWDARLSDAAGLAKPPQPARWGLYTTLERDFDFTQLRWTFDSTRAWMETANADQHLIEPLLQRRGVTAIVRFAPGVRWQGDRLTRPGGGDVVEVLSARTANPFVFAASRVEIVHGIDGWRARVAELGSEVTHTVCIEDDQLPAFTNRPGPAVLRAERTGPEDVSVEVDAQGPSPSFVAINQTWDPNWKVTLDGQPAREIRTDLDLSGVIVPPGRHRLALQYADAWVSAGVGTSTVATVSALLALLIARRRERQKR